MTQAGTDNTLLKRTHSYRDSCSIISESNSEINNSNTSRAVLLAIAGSDSSAMAGIQMDIRTGHALGVHVATAITATTAQNNHNVFSINPVTTEVLAQQLDAALVLQPQVIKIGLLCNCQQVELLAAKLKDLTAMIVYDPVLSSSSGQRFVDTEVVETIKTQLLPLCHCVTPNLTEAKEFSGITINNLEDSEHVAKQWLAGFPKTNLQANPPPDGQKPTWVIIKGGHADSERMLDYCINETSSFWLSQEKIHTQHHRGTGCALSSSIGCALARGYDDRDALVIAKMAIQQGLQHAVAYNGQNGATAIQHFPTHEWPVVFENLAAMDKPLREFKQRAFPPCWQPGEQHPLGLYPVVDCASWLERLLPLGISTAQLRIKHLSGKALFNEIATAVAISKRYHCRLFINDYWSLAIEAGAYGVHLGQEDLPTANLEHIHKAGLRLGISSHSHYEVAIARAIKPSYIACGPTFATTTKNMPWVPHGIEGLEYWQRALDCPLVAIGGINQHNIHNVANTGVSGIAMITGITLSDDPESTTLQLIQTIKEARKSKALVSDDRQLVYGQ